MAAHRPTVMGTRHAVSAGHHLAAQAAFQILEGGGNAVDAGCAAGIALGVLHSDIVNFAGVAPIMIYLAESGRLLSIDGLGVWPRAASIARFQQDFNGHIPEGVLRTVVPAAPDAWITALERYGTMSFGEVAAAAISYASDGFPMYPLMAAHLKEDQAHYERWPSSAAIYAPNGRPPVAGEVFVQADLGRTLRYMADAEAAQRRHGRKAGLAAARDAFYRGDIAQAIVRYHRENDGWMTAEDMAAYRVREEPVFSARFGALELYACGPWCQGPVLLQTLNLLDGTDFRGLGHNSPAYVHRLVEATKLAMADRHYLYGDPRFVEVPMERLLSAEYARARRGLIDPERAWPEMPPAGLPAPADLRLAAAAGDPPPPADTTYLCVVDRHGNAMSATPSDVSRDTPVIPGTGLCPSSRGSQSWGVPGMAASVAPGKRPRLTPNPAMVMRDGRPVLPFGTPGGDVQAQAMLQVFLNIFAFGMEIQEAIEAPRFCSYSFPDSFEPHNYYPGRLSIEERAGPALGDALRGLGHDLHWWPDWNWRAGGVLGILIDRERQVLHAGADPRRAGYALGR